MDRGRRRKAPLKLLGAKGGGNGNGQGDASRVLGSASLVVQQFAGITTEPVLVDLVERRLAAGDTAARACS